MKVNGGTRGLRVAVVGSGYWGQNLVRNFHEIGVLSAVCDSSEKALATFKTQYPECQFFNSYSELLSHHTFDAVAIATPAETHAPMVREALEAGKDVFVEKPLSLDVPTARSLLNLAHEKKRILMVGHLLWYHPAVLKLRELVDAGELGKIRYLYSNRLNMGKIRREENILWSFAPHDISVILGLLGEMPDQVIAQGGNYLHARIADVTVSCLSFPSGVKAHIFVSWLHPFKEQKLVVVGDRKMAVFDDLLKENKLVLYPHSIEWKGQVPIANKATAEAVPVEWKEPLRAECEHFMACVKTRQNPRTDGQEALKVLTVLQMCQQALESPVGSGARSRSSPGEKYFAHDSAFIDEDVEIGAETTIWHVSHILKGSRIGSRCRIGQNVVIGPRVKVGDNVKIQNNVSVYEGVTLESDVFCGPSMVFTNVFNPRSAIPRMQELKSTRVKQGATLGANSTIVCGNSIGRYAFVGAGAVVTKDVPDYALVVGSPARVVAWMCQCGVKLLFRGERSTCSACGTSYRKKQNHVRPVTSSRVTASK